jgi:hypothetical protein
MTDDEENKAGEEPKRFRPENFIHRLQSEGFVQWNRFTWIHPKDISLFIVKGKIKRVRRNRDRIMAQCADVIANMKSDAE